MKTKTKINMARGGAKGSRISPILIKRIIAYGILIFILCAAQCSFFSFLKPFGATPDLLLGMLVAIMLLDSQPTAAVCALVAGYMIDAIGAVPPAFSPAYYLACVTILSLVSAKMMPRFVSFCLILPLALLGRATFTFINICISYGALPSFSFAVSVIGREALSTFVFCLPIYFLAKICALIIGSRKKFDFI